jgi:hypothetical protein
VYEYLYSHFLNECTGSYNDDVNIEKYMKYTDEQLWIHAVNTCGIKKFLTEDKEKMITEKINKNNIPFSKEVADDLINTVLNNTDNIIASTFKEVFDKLTNVTFYRGSGLNDRVNNNKKEIEKKFRFTAFFGGITNFYIRSEHYQVFNDLETVCRLIDEKTRLEYPHRIGDKMQAEITKGNMKYENDYFKVQVFKKGSVLVEFKTDIYKKLNVYGSTHNRITKSLKNE